MEKQTIIFDEAEPKKHSVRYNTKQEGTAIDSIYVKRSALGASYPAKVVLTLEEHE